MSAFGAALVVCALALPRAHADGAGPYLSAALGGMLLQDEDLSGTGATRLAPGYEPGIAAAAALGWELPIAPVRIEAEASWRTSDVKDLTPTAVAGLASGTTLSASGAAEALAVMGNVYLFLPVPVGVEPYIGAGAGYARLRLDGLSAGGVSLLDGEDWAFAYQAIAGLELDFFPGPFDLGIEYRYFAVEDASISGASGAFDVRYRSHSVMARLRLGL